MDNPDTLAILGIQDIERRQTNQKTHNTIQQTKKMSNTVPIRNWGWTRRSWGVSSSCFLSDTRRVTQTYNQIRQK